MVQHYRNTVGCLRILSFLLLFGSSAASASDYSYEINMWNKMNREEKFNSVWDLPKDKYPPQGISEKKWTEIKEATVTCVDKEVNQEKYKTQETPLTRALIACSSIIAEQFHLKKSQN